MRATRFGHIIFALALALCVGSSNAWASISACPTTSGTAAPLSGFNSAGNGCSQIDKNFDNFTMTTTGNGSTTGDPTTSNVSLYATGGTISGSGASATITPILANFVSTTATCIGTGAGASQWVDCSGSDTLTSTTDYQVAINSSNGPGGGYHWAITNLTLALGTFTSTNPGNTGNTVDVKEEFCLGAATFNCTATSTNYGYIEEHVVFNTSGTPTITETICYNNGASSCTTSSGSLSLNLGGLGYTTIGIQDTVTINRITGAGTDIFLDGFDNQFGQSREAPEPSTFVLLGSLLVGLALLRRKQMIPGRDSHDQM